MSLQAVDAGKTAITPEGSSVVITHVMRNTLQTLTDRLMHKPDRREMVSPITVSMDEAISMVPTLATRVFPTVPITPDADHTSYIGSRTIPSPDSVEDIWDLYLQTGYFYQFPRLFVHRDTLTGIRALMTESAWRNTTPQIVVDLGGCDTTLINIFNPQIFIGTDFSDVALRVGEARLAALPPGENTREMRRLDLGSSNWGLPPGEIGIWNSFFVMSPQPPGAIEHQLKIMHAYSADKAEAFIALMLEGFDFGKVMRIPKNLLAVMTRNLKEMIDPEFIRFLKNSGEPRRQIQALVDTGKLIYPASDVVLNTAIRVGWEVVDARLSVNLGEPARAMVVHLRKV